MAESEQILILNPAKELHFKGSFTESVTSYLELQNPSGRMVCFKMKTTMPRKYSVTPNMGILKAQSSIEIAITLQSHEFDANEKKKHKFIVQSMFVDASIVREDLDWDALWKETSPSNFMNSKLNCVFDISSSNEALVTAFGSALSASLHSLDSMKGAKTASTTDLAESASELEIKQVSDEIDRLRAELSRSQHEVMRLRATDLATTSELKVQEANNEILRLRAELSGTHRDNMQLKEDIILKSARPSQELLPSNQQNSESNLEIQTRQSNRSTHPVLYLTCGMVIGSLTMLLKKYVF